MSNEYKDWRNDRIEEEKQIVKKYPFLRARDINGNIDTEAEFPMIGLEIPSGWYKLFYQMCEDIKPILEEKGILNDFYFIQVKEKYNFLRCYTNSTVFQEVEDIINKYEHMAHYICTRCGKPATCETQEYLASFCENCCKDFVKHKKIEQIEFKPYYKIFEGGYCEKTISFEEEWNKYLKENGYERSR